MANNITVQGAGYPKVTAEECTPGSPVYQMGRGSHRVERSFIIDWFDLDYFLKGALGFPYTRPTGNAAPYDLTLRRSLPIATSNISIPDTDGFEDWLWATGVSRIEGLGPRGYLDDSDFIPVFEKARVTLSFESLTYSIKSDTNPVFMQDSQGLTGGALKQYEGTFERYVTRVRKPSAEYVSLPRGTMQWVTASTPKVDFATARLLPAVELQWTWHEVPFIPAAASAYIGTVNDAPFSDGQYSYPKGTLLLLSADVKPYRHASGVFVHDITYRVKYFDPPDGTGVTGKGHNYFFHFVGGPAATAYVRDLITDDGTLTGKPVYQYTNFKNLFVANIS